MNGEASARGTGIFRVYRRGQGNVARGMAAGALGLIALFGCGGELGQILSLSPRLERVIWSRGLPFFETTMAVTGVHLVQGVSLLLCAWGIWALMNYARLVDFLIETEEEMRKVTWPWDPTARGVAWGIVPARARELVGNATVVLVSVGVLAFVLAVYDGVLLGGLQRYLGMS
ncbi:MAG: preprotein translocase subunit SecE [Planctomycetes bacterium]|nr:preprotein translocase subunit SecE [Planctomycetota bacterium]